MPGSVFRSISVEVTKPLYWVQWSIVNTLDNDITILTTGLSIHRGFNLAARKGVTDRREPQQQKSQPSTNQHRRGGQTGTNSASRMTLEDWVLARLADNGITERQHTRRSWLSDGTMTSSLPYCTRVSTRTGDSYSFRMSASVINLDSLEISRFPCAVVQRKPA